MAFGGNGGFDGSRGIGWLPGGTGFSGTGIGSAEASSDGDESTDVIVHAHKKGDDLTPISCDSLKKDYDHHGDVEELCQDGADYCKDNPDACAPGQAKEFEECVEEQKALASEVMFECRRRPCDWCKSALLG